MKYYNYFRRLVITMFIGFSFLNTYSQNALERKNQVHERTVFERNPPFSLNDTTIDVVYSIKQVNSETTAGFIDSVLVGINTIIWINPGAIRDVKILKSDTIIKDRYYKYQMLVKTHDSVKVNLMSLSEIRSKYTKSSLNKAIFVLKNRLNNKEELVTEDQKSKVDRNYIFRIIVDQMNLTDTIQKEPTPIDVIRILFRTQENINEANQIMIRGTDPIYPSAATGR